MVLALGTSLLLLAAPADAPDRPAASCDSIVDEAVRAVTEEEDLGRADTLLSAALERCPEDSRVLREAAGLRFRQDRFGEAEELALRLLDARPDSEWAWDLLGTLRYLTDDARGALRAWNRVGRPRVQDVRIEGADVGRPALVRAVGLSAGRILTPSVLVRGERALQGVPAVTRARLDYRPVPGGAGAVEGAVALGPKHPFQRSALPAHGLRALGGTVRLSASNSLGLMELWEMEGVRDGRYREVRVSLAHPTPLGRGVLGWELTHSVGRFAGVRTGPVRQERTGVRGTYERWTSAVLHRELGGGFDHWSGRGSFLRVGVGAAVVPPDRPWVARLSLDGWGNPDEGDLFGRAGFELGLRSHRPSGVDLEVRTGLEAISADAPPDLQPRFGAGRSATHLMRARSAVDEEGVVRLHDAGPIWAHGGFEVRRWARSPAAALGGVITLGAALFVDAAHALGGPTDPGEPSVAAVHVGAGLRARVPAVPGWLRADWAVDPADGTSRLSVAWVPER